MSALYKQFRQRIFKTENTFSEATNNKVDHLGVEAIDLLVADFFRLESK
mgnify:CR=1 FL=1